MPKAKNTKICCIFNLAPHYRSAIYSRMDKELGCDFYFGDQVETPIKLMDVSCLSGYKKTVRNLKILHNNYIWQRGVIGLVFKNYKFYIITGDHKILSSLIIVFLARILNKKVFLWMHGLKSNADLYWKEKLKIYSFYNLASGFLLYGDYSRDIMLRKGFKRNKMFCIYNSLDYDYQIVVRKNLKKSSLYKNHFGNELPVLLYVGRIQKEKKLDQILISMIILKQVGIECNLVIIGENLDQIDLNMIAGKTHMDQNLWIYGPCYDEKAIGELIYNADVCVSPGNVGLTAMHCLVYGTPIITNNNFETQMPEFEVIESGVTGDFFQENNVWDLADKIALWISLPESVREKVRNSAYEKIDSRYTPSYQIQVLKSIINTK